MSDDSRTVAELRAAVAGFVAARDWERFHNAKDLAVSIAIEAAELLEEYQWLDPAAVAAAGADPEARERVRLELADVWIYGLCLANALDIDLSQAVLDKLGIDAAKYPVSGLPGRLNRLGRGDFTVD